MNIIQILSHARGISIKELNIWLTQISAAKPDNGKNLQPAVATAISS